MSQVGSETLTLKTPHTEISLSSCWFQICNLSKPFYSIFAFWFHFFQQCNLFPRRRLHRGFNNWHSECSELINFVFFFLISFVFNRNQRHLLCMLTDVLQKAVRLNDITGCFITIIILKWHIMM